MKRIRRLLAVILGKPTPQETAMYQAILNTKVWLHFVARDINTYRQDQMMKSFPEVAEKIEEGQRAGRSVGCERTRQ